MVKETKEYMNSLKRVTDGTFYETLKKYFEARIQELDDQWTSANADEFKQLQGRKLEVKDMLRQLTSKPVQVEHLDGYGN